MEQQTFWQKNQVFISGLAAAILLALQQFIATPEGEIDWKVIGLAGAIAVGTFLGNEFRGKGVTIAGIIGIAGTSFATIQSTGHFSWSQFGFSVMLGFLALVAPPAKNVSYEQSPTIQAAKQEATVIKKVNEETPPPQL